MPPLGDHLHPTSEPQLYLLQSGHILSISLCISSCLYSTLFTWEQHCCVCDRHMAVPPHCYYYYGIIIIIMKELIQVV